MDGDLTQDEREALVALARHLVMADGQVSRSELFEMLRLEAELGDTWRTAVKATDGTVRDRAAVLALASRVERRGVQQRFLALLERLAEGDGVHQEEVALLAELRSIWG
ncbi:MAG: hypothetical protein H6737_20955 [Alphaproteobacteria bacterium]|nr:hypothetical protein [Alphaproteobacteria bacterium]